MAQELVTFGDILSSIREKLSVQSSDETATSKIKRIVNEIYLDEVVPFKPWFWLKKTTQVIHKEAYETGTVAVTNGSVTATLSTAPSAAIGSLKNYRFSIDGSTQVYNISAHTAESTTVTLSIAFQETTASAAVYKIWRDRIDLPTDAKETIALWHKDHSRPLDAVGPQGFRELEAADPKAEGVPLKYSTTDYFDPTVGDDELETDRYRQTQIYPSINDDNVIINVDYVQDVAALDDLLDEPLMPLGDRMVLFYGALSLSYSAISRNESEADRYWMRFQQKLARMAGNRDEGQDNPKLVPSANYVNSIRRSGLKRGR